MESLGLVLALIVLVSGTYDPGKEAKEYPYIVSIHKNAERRNYLCAGTLIATTWVLTTANCLTKLAFKVRHGDMLTIGNGTYSSILQRIHHRNSRGLHHAKKANRLTPRTNNIGLALIEEALNRPVATLSGVDYSAILGYQVTYFEFGFLPVFKARIYEINKKRIRGRVKKIPRTKLVANRRARKYKRLRNYDDNIPVNDIKNTIISSGTKVLRTGDGVAIKCQHTDHPGPSICVANRCVDLESVTDPRTTVVIPDYGAPLIHDKKVIGVTSEVETHYTRYTPVSLYLDWIHEHITRGQCPEEDECRS